MSADTPTITTAVSIAGVGTVEVTTEDGSTVSEVLAQALVALGVDANAASHLVPVLNGGTVSDADAAIVPAEGRVTAAPRSSNG